MPEDIEKMLYQLDNYEDIERIQKQWMQYQSANDRYEKQYSQQLGNIVEGNLKFKETKSIPTPAEQMHQFNDSIRQELYELHGKGKEQDYYVEPDEPSNDNQQRNASGTVEDFQLTWADASKMENEVKGKSVENERERDFKLDWDQQPEADNDNYQSEKQSKDMSEVDGSDRKQKVQDFKLTFDTMGEVDQEVDGKDLETERDNRDYEYDDD
jgi:hypothetical protein